MISGSSDSLRTALGGAWHMVSSSERGFQYTIDYNKIISTYGRSAPRTPDPGSYTNPYISFALRFNHDHDVIKDQYYSSKTVQPVIKYPIRLYGTNELLKNDTHWKSVLAGGTFDNQQYPGIFSGEQYFDHWFDYKIPYESLELRQSNLENKNSFSHVDIGYNYNYYYKEYEDYLSSVENERLIPNAYILQTISKIDDFYRASNEQPAVDLEEYSYSQCNANILNYLNREGSWPASDFTELLKTTSDYHKMMSAKPTEFAYMDESATLKKYFNTLGILNLEDKTKEYASEKLRHIIIDHDAVLGEFNELQNNKKALPMYAKVKLPPAGAGLITDNLIKNDASAKFLSTIKELFVDESITTINYETTNFTIQETTNLNPNKETNNFYGMDIKNVDMARLLFHMRESYLSTSDNFYCIGNKNKLSKRAVYDKTGYFRHLNTIAMTHAIAEFLDHADDDHYLEQIKSPYFETAAESKLVETVAYRIEKIGGPASGDSETQEVLQNFYIMNDHQIHRAEILDTQVKYGEDYTYKIYAYVIVNGYRYQASDLRVTKTISDLSVPNVEYPINLSAPPMPLGRTGPTGAPDAINNNLAPLYCLEFYDPFTGERKDRLVTEFSDVQGMSVAARSLENQFATEAQVASENYKYLADFNLTIQPSVRLLELPIASKTIRILDHPPNPAYALPFHVHDTSHKIGFDIEYRGFEKLPYPECLTENEEEDKKSYLASNSLTSEDPIEFESVATALDLEIYKIDYLPKSYKDFEGNLVTTINLHNPKAMAETEYDDGSMSSNASTFPDDPPAPPTPVTPPATPLSEMSLTSPGASASPRKHTGLPISALGSKSPEVDSLVLKDTSNSIDALFYDKIEPNKKYYYAMRFLNERGEPGQFSPIYCAELINDGGYLYGLFDTLYLKDLEADKKSINTTKDFKKLFNLVPNIQQLLLDDGDVDYSKPANSQKQKIKVGLVESALWDKTFKIRLTSKKTGKKIDLNITYKLSR